MWCSSAAGTSAAPRSPRRSSSQELDRAGLADGVRVSSAGTGGWHVGSPADDRAAALLRAEGYPDTHGPARSTPRTWPPT